MTLNQSQLSQGRVPSTTKAPQQPAPYIVPISTVPQTSADVRATRIKIDDLKRQLQDFAERRNTVASQLRRADKDARPGFQDRLANLDKSINGLQDQITQATLALTQAPTSAIVGGTTPGPDPRDIANTVTKNVVPIVAILSVFVLAPLSVTFARLFWRRSTPPPRQVVDQTTMNRLDQLQQSVDTIAIEVERISEGQRFVTRLLSERPALGAGGEAAEPIRAAQHANVPR